MYQKELFLPETSKVNWVEGRGFGLNHFDVMQGDQASHDFAPLVLSRFPVCGHQCWGILHVWSGRPTLAANSKEPLRLRGSSRICKSNSKSRWAWIHHPPAGHRDCLCLRATLNCNHPQVLKLQGLTLTIKDNLNHNHPSTRASRSSTDNRKKNLKWDYPQALEP